MEQKDVEIGSVHWKLGVLSRSKIPDEYCVIFAGTTHAPVRNSTGIQLIHVSPGVSGIWKFVPLPKPSFFVIVIENLSDTLRIFQDLDSFLCAHVLIARKSKMDSVVLEVIEKRNPFNLSVMKDRDHFIYFVDTDNPDSVTGITEAVSVGTDSPLAGFILN